MADYKTWLATFSLTLTKIEKSIVDLRLYRPVLFWGSSSWSLWDSSSLIAVKVFDEMTSLLSWSVDRPHPLRAAVYESSGYITFIARFCISNVIWLLSSNTYMKYTLNIKMLLLYASHAAENNIWNWWLFSTQNNFYVQSKNWRVNLSVKLILKSRNLHFFFEVSVHLKSVQ